MYHVKTEAIEQGNGMNVAMQDMVEDSHTGTRELDIDQRVIMMPRVQPDGTERGNGINVAIQDMVEDSHTDIRELDTDQPDGTERENGINVAMEDMVEDSHTDIRELDTDQPDGTQREHGINEAKPDMVEDSQRETDKLDNEQNVVIYTDEARKDSPRHPVDRGWAWVILAACAFEIFIHGGLLKSYGLLFVQYQLRFESTASDTALMNTIQNIVISVTGVIVMTFGLQKFTCRTVIVVGGILMTGSYLITAFLETIGVFYVIQGVVGGMGTSMIHPPMFAILGVYFDKHRGLANSLFVSGASVGSMVMAPLVTAMFDEYGYTGTFMLIAALFGNIIVAGLLMRPPESYSRTNQHGGFTENGTINTSDDKVSLNSGEEIDSLEWANGQLKQIANTSTQNAFINVNIEHMHHTATHNAEFNTPTDTIVNEHKDIQRMHSYEGDHVATNLHANSPLLQRFRALSVGNTISTRLSFTEGTDSHNGSLNKLNYRLEAMCRSQLSVYTSSHTLPMHEDKDNVGHKQSGLSSDKDTDIEVSHDEHKSYCCTRVTSSLQIHAMTFLVAIFDFSLLTNPVFMTFLAMSFCLISGMAIMPLYIPPHAKDVGISSERVAMLISLQSIVELVSRIGFAVIADRKLLRRSTILATSAFVVGTVCHLLRFMKKFPAFVCLYTVAGLCGGLYVSTFAALLAEFIGLAKYKSSLGFLTLCHGVSIAMFFSGAGKLRDSTGTYIASYHLFGALAYVGAALALMLPVVFKWSEKRQRRNLDPTSKS